MLCGALEVKIMVLLDTNLVAVFLDHPLPIATRRMISCGDTACGETRVQRCCKISQAYEERTHNVPHINANATSTSRFLANVTTKHKPSTLNGNADSTKIATSPVYISDICLVNAARTWCLAIKSLVQIMMVTITFNATVREIHGTPKP